SRVAARRIGERAGGAAETKALTKQVEELQQTNQKLQDRLTAIEARLDRPAPSSSSTSSRSARKK
ncbi:MAG: hypothetical protein O2798_10300, partial [Chloroflexi bacterium]|nr:hypothetical protein [Chloroflexota bacterium]